MKRLPYLTAVLLLAGCGHGSVPQNVVAEAPTTPPAGMIKLIEDPEVATYFDARSVALYQDNPLLRQFYLINNYLAPAPSDDKLPKVASSRTIRVISCQRHEMAQFGRVYFSQPFALGKEVARTSDIPQWGPFEPQSLFGMIRDRLCQIDAAHLRAGNTE